MKRLKLMRDPSGKYRGQAARAATQNWTDGGAV
jgi:hypothetical protein